MDLRSVLTSYYDLKSVKPELLSLIRDSIKHELVNIELYELLENEVSIKKRLLHITFLLTKAFKRFCNHYTAGV